MCKKCKNVECNNIILDNLTYCSFTCRNIYVNKYLRNYDKVKNTVNNKRENKINEYNKNPKYCKNCGEIISFEKKRNFFCSHSCSAEFNNKGVIRNKNGNSENLLKYSKKLKESHKDYYDNPKLCLCCDKPLKYVNRDSKFCSNKCRKMYYKQNVSVYKLYKSFTNFKFHVYKYTDYFNLNLVEKFGWYKAKNHGNNLNGVSRDHIFSVKCGFENFINPLLLSHPANCELMLQSDNSRKHIKSNINIEELLLKIENFDKKYGTFYKQKLKIVIEYDDLINEKFFI
jgi:hypothetical protein